MAIIGVDIGTSSCSVIVFNESGKILRSVNRKYTEYRENNVRELNPASVANIVLDALAEAVEKSAEPIRAISFTTLGESVVCTDQNDNVLCNSMVTGDPRGILEVDDIVNRISPAKTLKITGLKPNEMYTLPKLMWMKKNTDVLDRTRKIFFFEDYLGYLLTGERKVSYSSAARSMAFDIYHKKWDEQLLSLAGLDPSYFSEPVSSGTVIGTVTPQMQKRLKLNCEVIVVAGGHDQCCAALGSGVVDTSTGEDGHGTCEYLSIMLPQDIPAEVLAKYDLPCSPYVFPDKYFTGIEITTCGALMNWFRDTVFADIKTRCLEKNMDFFSYMDNISSELSTDIMVLPQFGSSGNPDINYDVSGVISGLTLHTRPEEIYLGIKESLAFQMKMAYDYACENGIKVEKIVLTGGGANSKLTSQIRANVFQLPVYTLECSEAGALGCMILCAVALGLYPDIKTCVSHTVRLVNETLPDKEKAKEYAEKFEKYKRLYSLMHLF